MTVPTLTSPPTPAPNKFGGDPVAFDTAMQNRLNWQDTNVTQMTAALDWVDDQVATVELNASIATAQASAASASASAAQVSANNAAADAGAALWVSGTTYALYVIVRSPLNSMTYKRIVAGAGTTDPSLDTTNWAPRLLDVSTTLPVMRPSLLLDFARARAVDGRITFTRASTATRTNANGLIESVASGVPRIDYDPVTLACKGLLVEESRTNLLTYSQDFDNAAWTKFSATINANVVIAPDGSLTADKLVESTALAIHYAYETQTVSAATAYTLTVYAKAAERSRLDLVLEDTGASAANFDLINGTVGAPHNAGTTNVSSTATISNVGNGWYRCSITKTTVSGTSTPSFRLSNGSTTGYTGDGASGLYIWGAQLEAGAFPTSYVPSSLTHTGRASAASFIGSNGLIQSASTGVARNSYNPLNLSVAPALLLEAAATNLLTYSEDFSNAVWTKNRATVTANAVAAPDGATTADKLVEDSTASNTHAFYQTVTSSATSATCSFYVKAGERSQLTLQCYTSPANTGGQVLFDLLTKTTSGAAAIGTGTAAASMVDMGNGWLRCVLSITGTSSTSIIVNGFITVSGSNTYSGDGTSGLYVWGAQLETGAFPTSYIATTTAQVTRAADTSTSAQVTRADEVANITGSNFSSWYRADEGTFLAAYDQIADIATGYPRSWCVGDGTNNNYIQNYVDAASNTNVYELRVGGVTQSVPSAFTSYVGAFTTTAMAYKVANAGFSKDGSAANQSLITASIPVVTKLSIGAGATAAASTFLNGHVARLAYYSKRLSNTELQAITA